MDAKFYKDAIFVQSAVNGKGVINSLREIIDTSIKENIDPKENPVLILFVDKLADLCDAREFRNNPLTAAAHFKPYSLAKFLVAARDMILEDWGTTLGTDGFNRHPLIRLLINTLYESLDLQLDTMTYSKAYDVCEQKMKEAE